jgi:uncharacterized RDD family membrane protein YckC
VPTPPADSLNTTGAPTATGTPGAPGTRTARLASPGIRIGAFTIDVLLATLCTVVIPLGILFLSWFSGGDRVGTSGATTVSVAAMLASAVVPLCALAIYAARVVWRGASIGHRLAGLRVVDLDTHQRATPGRLVLRTLALFAPLLIALVLYAPLALVELLPYNAGLVDALGAAALVAGVAVPVWWTVLLAQVATGRRALHDRAAGTMVLVG